jgi:hypothetical protein
MLPDWLRALLPEDTQNTWEVIRGSLPSEAYLVGGTAIAVHFQEIAVHLDRMGLER